jgi:hypothetical protein
MAALLRCRFICPFCAIACLCVGVLARGVSAGVGAEEVDHPVLDTPASPPGTWECEDSKDRPVSDFGRTESALLSATAAAVTQRAGCAPFDVERCPWHSDTWSKPSTLVAPPTIGASVPRSSLR